MLADAVCTAVHFKFNIKYMYVLQKHKEPAYTSFPYNHRSPFHYTVTALTVEDIAGTDYYTVKHSLPFILFILLIYRFHIVMINNS